MGLSKSGKEEEKGEGEKRGEGVRERKGGRVRERRKRARRGRRGEKTEGREEGVHYSKLPKFSAEKPGERAHSLVEGAYFGLGYG